MKQYIASVIFYSFLIPMTSHATGLYIGLDAGIGIFPATPMTLKQSVKNLNPLATFEQSYNQTFYLRSSQHSIMGASIGYEFATYLRMEGAFQYVTGSNIKLKNEQKYRSPIKSALITMANFYYDFKDLSDSFTPFIGIGVGYGQVSLKWKGDSTKYTEANLEKIFPPLKNSGFSYGAFVGLNYEMNAGFSLYRIDTQVSIDLKYSYNILPTLKISDVEYTRTNSNGLAIPLKASLKMSNRLHSITAGVKLLF